ncbi:MAG TPA: radical SAM family heme chaperone HemW [Chloroflexota bacterium]|nr:radical SAM family heme chaperone HemW [Chloroflexota bacterium]
MTPVQASATVDACLLTAPAPRPDTAGLYIHVPFCARLCPYCDFDTQDRDLQLISPYAVALVREVDLLPAARLHSVFFGGGTPSLLQPAQLAAVLDACRARFALPPDCEITVECNPNNVRAARLDGYRAAGVNRLSLGVQAMDDAALKLLGRQHTVERVRQAVATARATGFDDLSLDLMYGLPGQTLAAWERTLDAALALAPEHLSCYLLTLEDWTPMGQQVARGELALPDDDLVAAQYELTRARLAAAGLRQYEISNCARPGRESRHNLGYWRAEPYLALGPGAVSSLGGRRRKQTPVVADYLAAVAQGEHRFVEDERLDAATQAREALMLGLRLRAGVDLAAYRARFGRDVRDVCGAALDELVVSGFLEWHAGRLRLADRALLVSNEVLVRLGLA